jgi:hypothetical protein
VNLVEEYRRNAADCRTMASRERDPETKARMLDLAERWEMLALARGKFLLSVAEAQARSMKRTGQ